MSKTYKGEPNTYISDLTHKTLGKFDNSGKFVTDDPEIIRRMDALLEHKKSLEKKSLGKRLAEQAKSEEQKHYRNIAVAIVDVLIEYGVFQEGKEKK